MGLKFQIKFVASSFLIMTLTASTLGAAPECLSVSQRLAWLSIAKIRQGILERSPMIPASFSGKLHLTSGIEHLIPRAEGMPPIFRGLILITAASKPQDYAAVMMGGSTFGFSKPEPKFYKTDSALGPLLKLQHDGTGGLLLGSFFQERDGKRYALVVPMNRQHPHSGEVSAIPELGTVEAELTGGSLYYHIAPVPGAPMAVMLTGGFNYQVVGIEKGKGIGLGPRYEINPPPLADSSPMTFNDAVSTGFHWRYLGLNPKQSSATVYYTFGPETQLAHHLAPAKLQPNLQVTADWSQAIELKSDAGETPRAVRAHPTAPLTYVIYKDHYEIYVSDHLAGKLVRLEEKGTDGKPKYEFEYPSGLKNIEDIHFYLDLLDPATGETAIKIAAISRTAGGEVQINWLDDSRN